MQFALNDLVSGGVITVGRYHLTITTNVNLGKW